MAGFHPNLPRQPSRHGRHCGDGGSVMNGNQIFVGCFGLFSLAVSAWALWCVARSRLPYKPAWMLGCLFGFVGFGLVWTKADHLVLLLGIEIPPVNVFTIAATGDQIVKTGFPVVAVVALAKSRSAPTPTEPLPRPVHLHYFVRSGPPPGPCLFG